MIQAKFNGFADERQLPLFSEMIPDRLPRLRVKAELVLAHLTAQEIASPEASAVGYVEGSHVAGLEAYAEGLYKDVFAAALRREVVAEAYKDTVSLYANNNIQK